jgi:hypothetical protein
MSRDDFITDDLAQPKFPDSFFKIRLPLYGTMTVLTNPKLVDELRRAPDGALDFVGGAARVSPFKKFLWFIVILACRP